VAFSRADDDPAVGRSYQLGGGPRVRLRMVGPRDAAAIRALLSRRGLHVGDLELARLVRFDPRCRAVICASALIGPTETIVALGAIDLDAASPDMVIADSSAGDGLRELVAGALMGRARAHAA
jgi:hypothetical protein